jgi:hypothetical protein
MEQRAVEYPARSVDIRITDPNCEYGCFYLKVARALRHMADSLEAPGLASQFEATMGRVQFQVGLDRPITIEWAGADVIDRPQDPAGPDRAPADLAPTPEELASLTPAEREALGTWNVHRGKYGWRAENGQHAVFVASDDGRGQDDAQAIMIDTLRKAEIIGENEEPTFYFED